MGKGKQIKGKEPVLRSSQMTDDHIRGDGRDQNSPPAQLFLLTDEEAKKKCALAESDAWSVLVLWSEGSQCT